VERRDEKTTMLKVRNGSSDFDPKEGETVFGKFDISYHVVHLMSPQVTVAYICKKIDIIILASLLILASNSLILSTLDLDMNDVLGNV